MNKLFKCLSTAILGIAMAVGVGVGISNGVKVSEVHAGSATASFILSSASDATVDGVTAKFAANGGSNAPTWYAAGLRLYAKNTFTVSSSNTITGISIDWEKQGSKDFASATASVGTYSHPGSAGTGIWSGSATSVVFTLGNSGQLQLNTFQVTYTTGDTPTTTYTVTFDANGHGTAPTAATVNAGAKVTKPADPSASGFTFGGWYTEAACTNAYNFDNPVNSSFTLYAKWTQDGPTPVGEIVMLNADTLSLTDTKVTNDTVVNGYHYGGGGSGNGIKRQAAKGSNQFDGDDTILIGKTGAYVYNSTALDGNILKFEIFNNEGAGSPNVGLAFGTSVISSAPSSYTTTFTSVGANKVVSYENVLANCKYFRLQILNDKNGQFQIRITISKEPEKSLVSISTLSGKVSAKTGDTSWTISDVVVTGVLNDSPSVVDVKSYVTVSVTQTVPSITKDDTMAVTLKAVSNEDSTINKSVSVTATLKFINPYDLRQIYGSKDNTEVTIDGIYMGDVRDAMIIMDGEYGANIYYGTGKVPAHSYVPGVTVLTVTGTTTLYKGLEEVKPTSVSVLTDQSRIDRLQIPQTYICTGDESSAHPELASRKTHATGYVTAISDASGNKNVTLKVNGKSIAIFIGSVYATEDVMTKLNDSKDNETNITIEGFTSFYNSAFQVQFTGLVEQKVDYLAENFAQDLLDLTDVVCDGYDGVTNNKDALAAVWLVLQDADHYLGLSEIEKAKLVAADADEAGDVVERAMARYDYLVAKYSLSNFITRSTITISSGVNFMNVNSNTTIIALIAVIALSVVGGYIYIRRRKEY